jgi:filamentous hemagglutinin family protein
MSLPKTFHKPVSVVTLMTFTLLLIAPPIYALPTGADIQSGDVSISTTPDNLSMNVISTTNKSIINWNDYNISGNETVNYVQPNSGSISLNRDLGGDASQIFGSLNSNGRVWLLNPNGVMFGPSSRINAAGLLASSLNLSDQSFLNNTFIFTKNQETDGFIINKGSIAVSDGGYVALMGESVLNEGLIEARLGKAVLAAGEAVTLELDSDGMISVAINDSVTQAFDEAGHEVSDAVKNAGTVSANGGTVILTASVLGDVFTNAVNNEGVIAAGSLVDNNGEIYLLADGTGARIANTGVLDVSGIDVNAKGGYIEICADKVGIEGTLNAKGKNATNGSVYLDPRDMYILTNVPGIIDLLDSYTLESTLELANSTITIQTDQDIIFDLDDNYLDLAGLSGADFSDPLNHIAGDMFNVRAGRHILLNDTMIVTNGASIDFIADVAIHGNKSNGVGDIKLEAGSGIKTNGGNVYLHGANIMLDNALIEVIGNPSEIGYDAQTNIWMFAQSNTYDGEIGTTYFPGEINITDSIIYNEIGSSLREDGLSFAQIDLRAHSAINIDNSSVIAKKNSDLGAATIKMDAFQYRDVTDDFTGETLESSEINIKNNSFVKALVGDEGSSEVVVDGNAMIRLQADRLIHIGSKSSDSTTVYGTDSLVLADVSGKGESRIDFRPYYNAHHGDILIENATLMSEVNSNTFNEGTFTDKSQINLYADSMLEIDDSKLIANVEEIGYSFVSLYTNKEPYSSEETSINLPNIIVKGSDIISHTEDDGNAQINMTSAYTNSEIPGGDIVIQGLQDNGGDTVRVTNVHAHVDGEGSANINVSTSDSSIRIDGAKVSAQVDSGINTAQLYLSSKADIDIVDSEFEAKVLNDGNSKILFYATNAEAIDGTITIQSSSIESEVLKNGNANFNTSSGNLGIGKSKVESIVNGIGNAELTLKTYDEGLATGAITVDESLVSAVNRTEGLAKVDIYTDQFWDKELDNSSILVKASQVSAVTANKSQVSQNDAYLRLAANSVTVANASNLFTSNTGDGSSYTLVLGKKDGVFINGSTVSSFSEHHTNPRRIADTNGDYSKVEIRSDNLIDIDSSMVIANVVKDGTAWIAIDGSADNGSGFETNVKSSYINTTVGGSGHGDIDIRANNGDLQILGTRITSVKKDATESTEVELRAKNLINVNGKTDIRSIASTSGIEKIDIASTDGNTSITNSTLIADAGAMGIAEVDIQSTNADVIIQNAPETVYAMSGNALGQTVKVVVSGRKVNILGSTVSSLVGQDGNAHVGINAFGSQGVTLFNSKVESNVGINGAGTISIKTESDGGSISVGGNSLISINNGIQDSVYESRIDFLSDGNIQFNDSNLFITINNGGAESFDTHTEMSFIADDYIFMRNVNVHSSIAGNGNPKLYAESHNQHIELQNCTFTTIVNGVGVPEIQILAVNDSLKILYDSYLYAKSDSLGGSSYIALQASLGMLLTSADLHSLGDGLNGGVIDIKVTKNNIDASMIESIDVIETDHLILEAGGTCGTSSSPIQTDVDILTAIAHGGNVCINEVSDLRIEKAEAHGSLVEISTGGYTIINNVSADGDGYSDPAEIRIDVSNGPTDVVGDVTAHNASDGDALINIYSDGDINVNDSLIKADVIGSGNALIVLKSRGDVESRSDINLSSATISASIGDAGHSEINLLAPQGKITADSSFLTSQYLAAFAFGMIGDSLHPIQMDVDILSAYSSGIGDLYFVDTDDVEVGAYLIDGVSYSSVRSFLSEGDGDRYGISVAANDGLINIVSNNDMVVNSVVSPRGGIYLESVEGSIYAGQGFCPVGFEDFSSSSLRSQYIDDVLSSLPMLVYDTKWFSTLEIEAFSPIKLNPKDGPNVLAGGYSYFSTPKGTIGVGYLGDQAVMSGGVYGVVNPGVTAITGITPSPAIDTTRFEPPSVVLFEAIDSSCIGGELAGPPGGLVIDSSDEKPSGEEAGSGGSSSSSTTGPKQIWPAVIDPALNTLDNPLIVVNYLVTGAHSALPERYSTEEPGALTLEIGGPSLPPQPNPDPDPDQNFTYLLADNLRFRIPKKDRVDSFSITHTQGPIGLTAPQAYFYHPLFEMNMYETPAMGVDVYEFIDGQIGMTVPNVLTETTEDDEDKNQ